MLICSETDSLHIQVCKSAPLNANQLRVQFTSPSNVQGSVLSVQASVLKVWNYFTLPLNRIRMQICSESDLLRIQTHWDSPLNAILLRSQITSHSNMLGFMFELHLNADLLRGQTYLTTQCVVSSTATLGDQLTRDYNLQLQTFYLL